MCSRLLTVAALATLLLAGFGCRPLLDAPVGRVPAPVPKWVQEDPAFSFAFASGYDGDITVTVRVKPSNPPALVTATMRGPGLTGSPTVMKTADADGLALLRWPMNRLGRYLFSGTVGFNGTVVESFDGAGDVY